MRWYTGNIIYDTVLFAAFVLVGLTIAGVFFFTTPYGRFGTGRVGLKMSPRLGWFLMEFPASVCFLYFYCTGEHPLRTVSLVFLAVWCIHYANRGYIFPALIRVAPGYRQTFNLAVVASGWLVTSLHGYLNGSFIAGYGAHLTDAWLTDPRFIIGIIVYYAGYLFNLHSDHILRNLRPQNPAAAQGAPRYTIPRGGGFTWVSNPHYLAELIAWSGFAIATWSLAGVFILTISAANLLPRALANHRWYRETFPDYPADRKAILPYIL